ncbi:MAG: alpha/beta hydrolase [Oscillospiraceae bacterium]|nr:alpha/beta hydrolase [Oscillospiraceae bacterium]
MANRKLAVICPGIGYHADKPLLYYAAKLAKAQGCEILSVTYCDMPQKIRGDLGMMRDAAARAYAQTEAKLAAYDPAGYEEVLLIGKSIGTIAAAMYNAEHSLRARQILYTPLDETFSFISPGSSCIAFVGDADPWSEIRKLQKSADAKQIPLSVYSGCNHSLESGDILRDITILEDVMQKTAQFIQ